MRRIITLDRFTNAHSRSVSTQLVQIDANNVKEAKLEQLHWVEQPVVAITFSKPSYLIGPSTYVRLQDLATELGIETHSEDGDEVKPRTTEEIFADVEASLAVEA